MLLICVPLTGVTVQMERDTLHVRGSLVRVKGATIAMTVHLADVIRKVLVTLWTRSAIIIKTNGEPCSVDSDCLSGRCPSNFPSKCKPLAGPGQGCANNKDCIDGYYCPFVGLNRKCKRRKNRSTSAGWNYWRRWDVIHTSTCVSLRTCGGLRTSRGWILESTA